MNGALVFMAKFKFEGMDEYITALGRIGGKQAANIIKYAVYPGAGIIADGIRASIDPEHKDTGDLAQSIALARIRNDNGYINTKVMFAGYDSKGVPNAIKAASLESGNSRGQKGTHFISHVIKNLSREAIKHMDYALDEKIGQIMGD